MLTSRERLLMALKHQEPDRVPFDMGSTQLTGIATSTYVKLREHLGLPTEPIIFSDEIQQVALPTEDFLEMLGVDTRGLFPLCSHNLDVGLNSVDVGKFLEYRDEWGITHHLPKENGLHYSIVKSPLENIDAVVESIQNHSWPLAGDQNRIKKLRQIAVEARDNGRAVVLKGICAGLFEMHQRIRGMENALMDSMLYPEFSDLLIGKIADLKIEFWNMALDELHDVVDVIVEADDYGTQASQLISPDQFRISYKPHIKRVIDAIKNKAPNSSIFFHSCGNVRPIIPDFIELGIDILNPVHITAEGMDPISLKKDFGNDICFWGGGVETQNILPKGTPQQVRDDVKRNIEALAVGGGFVFNTVHNIQPDVPVENIIAMVEALKEFGKY